MELDELLAGLGLPLLAERFPVLAYGANRNPATLHTKLRSHLPGYVETSEHCLPVLRGWLAGADVVACQFHGQGYLYGELLMGHPAVAETEVEVYVCLADQAQMAALHDSESVRSGLYAVAAIPDVRFDGCPEQRSALGYVAGDRAWCSPALGQPLRYTALPARRRNLPEMTSREMVDHVLDVLELRGPVAKATGLADDGELARELAAYLNGQWWYRFHTAGSPVRNWEQTLRLLRDAMGRSTLELRTADLLHRRGLLLGTEDAYAPPARLRWTAR